MGSGVILSEERTDKIKKIYRKKDEREGREVDGGREKKWKEE